MGPEQLEGAYPNGFCLHVGYVLLAELPCLASVGEDELSPDETQCARVD